MSLYADHEIEGLLIGDSPLLEDFAPEADYYAAESLVQPSSLDLHIGGIFVPPTEEKRKWFWQRSEEAPVTARTEYILKPGQTAVVSTRETMKLPANVAAFGFPPTRLSNRAVLMTNPGHVDPGYVGKLQFTLINMGREDVPIRRGDPVVTLLLSPVGTTGKGARKDYAARGKSRVDQPSPDALGLLGHDFLDIDRRTREIADQTVRHADLRIRWAQYIAVPIVSALLAGAAAWFQYQNQIDDLRDDMAQIQEQVQVLERLIEVESRLEELSRQRAEGPAE